MKLFDTAFKTLMRTMDVRMIRQTMLNNNVANVDTPTYVPQDVDFHAAMKGMISEEDRTLESTQNNHISDVPNSSEMMFDFEGGYGEIPTFYDETAEPSIDGNQVDIDTTMSHLAQNALQYNAAARSITKKLAMLKYVSTDGQSG